MGENELSILGWLGVSLMIFTSCISFAYLLANQGKAVAQAKNLEQSAVLNLREYREYSPYDDKIIYSADAISLIFEYRGEKFVRVYNTSGTLVKGWELNVANTYTSAAIGAYFDVNRTYKATLVYESGSKEGGTGEVIGFALYMQ